MTFKYETYGKWPLCVLLPWALPTPGRPASSMPAKASPFLPPGGVTAEPLCSGQEQEAAGHTPSCLPPPDCLPALSKLGLPRNFVAVDHFVKCKVLAQEPFGITACEVGRVPRVRRRLVELPTAAELGGGRS